MEGELPHLSPNCELDLPDVSLLNSTQNRSGKRSNGMEPNFVYISCDAGFLRPECDSTLSCVLLAAFSTITVMFDDVYLP